MFNFNSSNGRIFVRSLKDVEDIEDDISTVVIDPEICSSEYQEVVKHLEDKLKEEPNLLTILNRRSHGNEPLLIRFFVRSVDDFYAAKAKLKPHQRAIVLVDDRLSFNEFEKVVMEALKTRCIVANGYVENFAEFTSAEVEISPQALLRTLYQKLRSLYEKKVAEVRQSRSNKHCRGCFCNKVDWIPAFVSCFILLGSICWYNAGCPPLIELEVEISPPLVQD